MRDTSCVRHARPARLPRGGPPTYSMVTVTLLQSFNGIARLRSARSMLLVPLPALVPHHRRQTRSAGACSCPPRPSLMPTVSVALSTSAFLDRRICASPRTRRNNRIAVFALPHVPIRAHTLSRTSPCFPSRFALQFLFVGALLTLLFLGITARPGQARLILFEAGSADWLPTGWFLALFERLRGGGQPELATRAWRAVLGTTAALAGAVLVCVAGFKRQSQLALAPSASVGAFAGVRVGRALTRLMIPGDPVAQAAAAFILRTLARCRAQQELIAINAALGAAIVIAGFVRGPHDLASLTRPRTATLWIPLVLAYSVTIGLRASFYVPSELRCSWMFRANGPYPTTAYWSATRASMIAFVVPPTAIVAAAILTPPSAGAWRRFTRSACAPSPSS